METLKGYDYLEMEWNGLDAQDSVLYKIGSFSQTLLVNYSCKYHSMYGRLLIAQINDIFSPIQAKSIQQYYSIFFTRNCLISYRWLCSH